MHTPFDIPLAEFDDPNSVYLKLRELQPRYLIESNAADEQRARFSYLGFGGALEFRLDEHGLCIGQERRASPSDKNEYLDALRCALDQAPILKPQPEGLDFSGGLVGVHSYDITRTFVPGQTRPQSDLPHAALCATESLLVFDHQTQRAALLHCGTESARESLRRNIVHLLTVELPPNASETNLSQATLGMSKSDYENRVEECKKYIAAGDIEQIVISLPFKGHSKVSPFDVYRALRVLNPSPYMFFFDFGALKVVGSSPEMLARLQGREASLRPIAGTIPRGGSTDEDIRNEKALLADPKESDEHEMLINSARNDLARVVTTDSLRIAPYRSIERYSHVMHIVSGVHGELAPELDAFDLYGACLPAGTLVGAPKQRAMEIIEELEISGRGFYAGTAGYFGTNGNMDQAITIRTIVFNGNEYSFQAGGGIVADSVPEKEYQEVLVKSEALRQAIKLAEKGL